MHAPIAHNLVLTLFQDSLGSVQFRKSYSEKIIGLLITVGKIVISLKRQDCIWQVVKYLSHCIPRLLGLFLHDEGLCQHIPKKIGLEEHQNPPYRHFNFANQIFICIVFFDHKIFYCKEECCHRPGEKVLGLEGGQINAHNYVNVDGEFFLDEDFHEKVY